MWEMRKEELRVTIKTLYFTGPFEVPQITFYWCCRLLIAFNVKYKLLSSSYPSNLYSLILQNLYKNYHKICLLCICLSLVLIKLYCMRTGHLSWSRSPFHTKHLIWYIVDAQQIFVEETHISKVLSSTPILLGWLLSIRLKR